MEQNRLNRVSIFIADTNTGVGKLIVAGTFTSRSGRDIFLLTITV